MRCSPHFFPKRLEAASFIWFIIRLSGAHPDCSSGGGADLHKTGKRRNSEQSELQKRYFLREAIKLSRAGEEGEGRKEGKLRDFCQKWFLLDELGGSISVTSKPTTFALWLFFFSKEKTTRWSINSLFLSLYEKKKKKILRPRLRRAKRNLWRVMVVDLLKGMKNDERHRGLHQTIAFPPSA